MEQELKILAESFYKPDLKNTIHATTRPCLNISEPLVLLNIVYIGTTRFRIQAYYYCCKITVSKIALVLCIGARQLVQHSYITNSSSCNITYIAEVQNVGSTMTNQR
jgi:hypothetical protein